MRIKELKIFTSNLTDQKEFYTNILDFDIYAQSHDAIFFKIGNTILKIVKKQGATPYHFAINIPANKETEALAWLQSRVEILKEGNNEVHNFAAWNAKAMYFYDNDKNIVELIARRNLGNESIEKFDQNLFLEVSEIGLATDDIGKQVYKLNKVMGVNIFDGGLDRFCAIGNEHGLLICINKEIKDWYPTNDKAFASEFEIVVEVDKKLFRIMYESEELNILDKVE